MFRQGDYTLKNAKWAELGPIRIMKAQDPEQYLMLKDGESCGMGFDFNDRRKLWSLAVISEVKDAPLLSLNQFEEKLVLKLVELLCRKPRTNRRVKK
jgi:hypothetical protein